VDPRRNPYSPGAGVRPVELAGRDDQLEAFDVVRHRAVAGRSARSTILTGLRGVGKTVLLNEMLGRARADGWITRAAVLRLRSRARWDRATRAEREYLAAMAVDSAGPSSTGEIAQRLGKRITSLGPARANLIAKGLVYAPEHGQIAFTVPGMADFIARRPS
jgi:hypothetical protein